jgi:hypothetical protein
MSFYQNVIGELETILKAGTYSQPVEITRQYIASLEAKDLPCSPPWKVSLTPIGFTGQPGDREGLMEANYQVGMEFLALLTDFNNVELIDSFFTVIEELQDQAAKNPLTTSGYLVFPYENATAFDQSTALEQITFKNLTTFTYRVARGL